MSRQAWIQDCLPALLEARALARWRPTTVQPGSFSSRCMGVLAAIDAWVTCPTLEALGHVTCRLILIVHDLRPAGVAHVARTEVASFDEMCDGGRPADVWMGEPILDAWREWRIHRSDHAKVCWLIEHSLCRVLSYAQEHCPELHRGVEGEIERMKRVPATDGGCHPDT